MEATPGERKTLAAMASLCSGPISCQSTRTPGEGSTVKAAGKAMSGDLQMEEVVQLDLVNGLQVMRFTRCTRTRGSEKFAPVISYLF